MALVTFKLYGKSISDIVERVKKIIDSLTTNVAVYATPVPSTLVLTGAVNNLENSYKDALNGGKDKKALMMINKDILMQNMTTLQGYIQAASGGDAAKILLVADVKNARNPVGILSPPSNVRGRYGYTEGSIKFMWDGVHKSKMYKVAFNDSPTTSNTWTELGLTGKLSFTVNNLTSGQPYGLRVATVSSEGVGGWSDPAIHKAP